MSALTYLAAWRRIAARIRGLEKAASVHASFLSSHSGSPYGADKALQKQREGVLQDISRLKHDFAGLLPAEAHAAIDRFMSDGGHQIQNNQVGDALLVRTILVKVIALESELTYCLDNPSEGIRSASELAFMHLQRQIVADEDYRAKWQAAFDDHETHCERLGGVHMLWHGIWAFKVDASGGKTDLVYQEPVQTAGVPVALAMVLTEWKRT